MNERQRDNANILAAAAQGIREDTYDPNQGRAAGGDSTEYKKIIKRFKTFVGRRRAF